MDRIFIIKLINQAEEILGKLKGSHFSGTEMENAYQYGVLISRSLINIVSECKKLEGLKELIKIYESETVMNSLLNGESEDIFGVRTYELQKSGSSFILGKSTTPEYWNAGRVSQLLDFLEKLLEELNYIKRGLYSEDTFTDSEPRLLLPSAWKMKKMREKLGEAAIDKIIANGKIPDDNLVGGNPLKDKTVIKITGRILYNFEEHFFFTENSDITLNISNDPTLFKVMEELALSKNNRVSGADLMNYSAIKDDYNKPRKGKSRGKKWGSQEEFFRSRAKNLNDKVNRRFEKELGSTISFISFNKGNMDLRLSDK